MKRSDRGSEEIGNRTFLGPCQHGKFVPGGGAENHLPSPFAPKETLVSFSKKRHKFVHKNDQYLGTCFICIDHADGVGDRRKPGDRP